MSGDPGTSNHDKYTRGARNPIVGALIDRLFARVALEIAALAPDSVLDAGCGEGHALDRLGPVLPPTVAGFDLNPAAVAHCRAQHPQIPVTVQDIFELPYADAAFDVVLCMEVLEHLADPVRALAELRRVCGGHLILTVPFEPWFQLGNLARGQHLAGWGNHPEHVQHWGRRSFAAFLQAQPDLADVRVSACFPWLVARARALR